MTRPTTISRPPHPTPSRPAILLTALAYLALSGLFWIMVRVDIARWQMTSSLLGILIVFAMIVRRFTPWLLRVPHDAVRTEPRSRLSSAPAWMLVLAVVLTLLGARARYVVGDGAPGMRVYIYWLAGITLFAVAAGYPALAPWWRSRSMPLPRHISTVAVTSWTTLLLAAAIPRLLVLQRGPDFVNEDEGRFILMASAARDGVLVNPFASGWLGVPQLYPVLQGAVASITGTDVAAYRSFSALLGVATVVATWRLGRQLVGEWSAYAGALTLATMPFHLRFSRSALNHVTDSLVLVLALLFLVRATRSGRRGDALVAGIAVGVGWYGYWGARVFPVVVAILLGIAATDRAVGWRRAVTIAAWASAGFLATTAPLLMTYRLHPAELRGRFDATAGLSVDALGEAPWETTRAFLGRLRDAALMPIGDNRSLFFLHEAPFLGWPVALMLLAGLGIWLARLATARTRRHVLWLVVPWGIIAAGIAATDVVQSQRAVALAPIWALAAGTGLVAMLRLVTARMPRQQPWAVPLVAFVLLAVLGAAETRWYMDAERQRTTFGGDPRTLAAWDLGWRLASDRTPKPPRVLFAGPPFMFIDDWGNLHFQAPDADVQDVEGSIDDVASVPDVPAGTVLVLVPERAGEACTIVTAAPELTVAEARARDGTLLYMAFSREGSPAWHPGSTPAGTTFDIIPTPDCAP